MITENFAIARPLPIASPLFLMKNVMSVDPMIWSNHKIEWGNSPYEVINHMTSQYET